MKKFYFLLLALWIVQVAYSQPWLKNLPANKSKSEYTFFDYQEAFESYFAAHPVQGEPGEGAEEKESGDGWIQFKRWEYQMQGRIDKVTGEFPKKSAQQVCDEYYKTHLRPRSTDVSNWSSLGPDYSYSGYSGVGRLNCVAFHPSDLNTYWVGAAAGGLWVTRDNGNSWTCLTDQNGVLAVSDIIIPQDYELSHTIYIATGDREIWDNRSIGVLKSTDEGVTWNPTGITYSVYDGAMVNRLLIDPNNSNVLIAASNWGVYKTVDGGTTWNQQLTGYELIDMEYQPGNFNQLYGSTKYGQIFYSDNGGNSWAFALNDPAARRIELAVSPEQPGWVYAVAASEDAGLHGIFKSINFGVSYTQVFYRDTANLLTWAADGQDSGGQGWYDLCLAVSPTDANTLLVGGINTWRSRDGGLTWKIVNHWYGDQVQAVHADKHNIRYRSNGDVFETNDGGIYLSPNNGSGWIDKSNGIVISQMYRLGVSQTEAGDVITGLQDNGTKSLSAQQWDDVKGGDGMECWIDYANADIQYATLYYGQLDRTDDHWNGSVDITPYEAGDGSWVTPFVIDPVDPDILYGGFADVWQTLDRGASWFPISFFNSSSTLQSLAIAPSDNQVLYAADQGVIRRTTNLGNEWTDIRYNLPSDLGSIAYISVKKDDPFTLWVALSGFNGPGVFQLANGDSVWTNISAGLPPIPVYSVVQNNEAGPEVQLFAGTELGIYLKKGSEDWIPYVNGLPNVRIGELEMYYDEQPGESRLRAATYGRGLWESPVPTAPLGGIAALNMPVCFDQAGSITLESYFGNIQWQRSGDGISGWENVIDGNGSSDPTYITPSLTTTAYYRAEVAQPDFEPAYSNVLEIPVIPYPDDAGPIAGSLVVCQGEKNVTYTIDSIPNATTYAWTLPNGVTGSSTTTSITVDFGFDAESSEIEVSGKNGECEGVSSILTITVNPAPLWPVIANLEQPTCTIPTGIVYLSNLPDSGPWVLTNWTDSSSIQGEGSEYAITDLPPGHYDYGIMNVFGCSSETPVTIVIEPQPVTPPTPTITENDFVLHSDAPIGNQWYNEDGIIPGATGQDYAILEGGDYYVIVTLKGCPSAPSNSLHFFNESIGPGLQRSTVNLFPNPMRNELKIDAGDNASVLTYEVRTILGQIVEQGTLVNQVSVNTASFAPGLYLVKLYTGQNIVMKRVVKE